MTTTKALKVVNQIRDNYELGFYTNSYFWSLINEVSDKSGISADQLIAETYRDNG